MSTENLNANRIFYTYTFTKNQNNHFLNQIGILFTANNQFRNYKSDFPWILWPIGTSFISLIQSFVLVYFILDNSEFLVSELVVGSGEQNKIK